MPPFGPHRLANLNVAAVSAPSAIMVQAMKRSLPALASYITSHWSDAPNLEKCVSVVTDTYEAQWIMAGRDVEPTSNPFILRGSAPPSDLGYVSPCNHISDLVLILNELVARLKTLGRPQRLTASYVPCGTVRS